MRPRTMLSLLLPAALACSGREPSPTEVRPEFAIACPRVTITASPTSVTKSPNSTGSTKFIVKNDCTTNVNGLSLTSSRTGVVTAVGSPSPATLGTLVPGASATVSVSFSVGSSGTGTVVLTGTPDNLGTASTGTQAVTVSGGTGVPFGPSDLFATSSTLKVLSPFTLTLNFTDPAQIITQIKTARAKNVSFVPAMTGGNHAQYLDSTTTPFKFSFAKWKAKLNTFNTQAIRAAVDTAVRDTTIPFVTLMDEPDNPSWGPTGTMTHALVDSMSVYSKSIFPTLKTGVAVTWKWEKTTQYPSHSVDLIISQYSFSADTIVQRYVDSAVVSAKRQLVGLMLSMNVLDGGGRTFGSAQMTAAQVKNFGNVLVSAPFSCGLLMWKWDDTFMANAGNKASFDSVAATAARRPAKPCGK